MDVQWLARHQRQRASEGAEAAGCTVLDLGQRRQLVELVEADEWQGKGAVSVTSRAASSTGTLIMTLAPLRSSAPLCKLLQATGDLVTTRYRIHYRGQGGGLEAALIGTTSRFCRPIRCWPAHSSPIQERGAERRASRNECKEAARGVAI